MVRRKNSHVYLDTHIVCWLYEGRVEKLSKTAYDAIENGRLVVSCMVDLELEYLFEIGRINQGPQFIIPQLMRDLGVRYSSQEFPRVIYQARQISWTRDVFDRLIVADTMCERGACLVTKDRLIRNRYDRAVW